MNFCKNCGAGLGIGRFCTNCGAPISPAPQQASPGQPGSGPSPAPAPESPAEQTAIRLPAVQPDASTGTRFPLYADEVPTRSPSPSGPAAASQSPYVGQAPQQQPSPSQHPSPYAGQGGQHGSPPPVWTAPPLNPDPAGGEPSHRSGGRKRSPLIWAVPLVLALLFATTIGIWLGSGDDEAPDARADQSNSSPSPEESGETDEGEPDDEGTDPVPPSPTAPDQAPVDLAGQSEAAGPRPVAPGRDLANKKVRYPPKNMLDGDPATAYRMPGNAAGSTITFTLPGETTIHEVGLVNGYAKTDSFGGRTVDWYKKNRRITEVEWIFDDGTTVTQELRNSSDLQVIAVEGAVTETVQMRIVSVSKPGPKPLSKNVTAISTVLLRGN